MNNNPASTRLVPAERLTAITSLIAEGAVFDGNFHTTRDQGIKVDGQLKGNITFETGGTLHVGATGVIENTRLEADYVFIEGKVIARVIWQAFCSETPPHGGVFNSDQAALAL